MRSAKRRSDKYELQNASQTTLPNGVNDANERREMGKDENVERRKERNRTWLKQTTVAIALIFFLCIWRDNGVSEPLQSEGERVHDDTQHDILLDTMCDVTGKQCFHIVERMGGPYSSWKNRPARAMKCQKSELLVMSEMALKWTPPKGEEMFGTSSEYLESGLWNVDKTSLSVMGYQLSFLSKSFGSGGLLFDSDTAGNVLILGLGGGVMPSFYNEAFPKLNVTSIELYQFVVDVARKWFELPQDSPNFRVLIGDAAEYAKRGSERGETYSVIINDATLDGFDAEVLAPVEETIQDDVIRAYSQMITKGVYLANVIVVGRRVEILVEAILFRHLRYFEYCDLSIAVEGRSNLVLICSHSPISINENVVNKFVNKFMKQ